MTEDELGELETQLAAKIKQIAALNKEAEEMAERIIAERERRRTLAAMHELRRNG